MKRTFFAIISLLLLTGCWDREELGKIGIVSAIGIDKDPENGEYIFTSQLLKPAAESAQSPSPSKPFVLVSTRGKTIFEAIRNTNQLVDRRGFYAHNKVIIISEDIAKEGVLSIIDSFKRGKDIRGYVYLSIAKGTSAQKILETETSGVANIPADFLKSLLDNTSYHLNAFSTDMLTFYKDALGDGIEPVVGVLYIKEKVANTKDKGVKLSGAAVFLKDQLIGFLNESETRGLRWIKGDVETGAIALPSTLEEGKFITVEVKKMKVAIKPKVKGDQLSFTIEVDEDGLLTELQSTVKMDGPKQLVDLVHKVEEENKKLIEDEINSVIEKAQKEFQADIFGFGKSVEKKYPDRWNKVKDNWPQMFADVPYEVKVNVNITSAGLMKGPFKPVN